MPIYPKTLTKHTYLEANMCLQQFKLKSWTKFSVKI